LGKQLTVPFDARIFAFAQVHIPRSGPAFSGECQLQISDGTGPQNGFSQMDVAVTWTVPEPSPFYLTVPIAGVSMKPAGTYNVVVLCQIVYGQPGPAVNLTELMVWTAAQ
jgi:hypothetical protein